MRKKKEFSSNKRESTGLKHFNDPKAFIECSNMILICKMLKILKNTI